MKIIKKTATGVIAVVLTAVVCALGYCCVMGYRMYSEALERLPIEEMVEMIRSDENFTPLDELPDMYKKAVVSVEDRRFYYHPGIDAVAIARAICHDVMTLSAAQGGSTITQQLAKNIYFSQERRLERKFAEVFMAFTLELRLSKDEILELYVNSIYFGRNYYNIGSASYGYFGKAPSELTDAECTLLAGIPNAPSIFSCDPESALRRQNQVLRRLAADGVITEERREEISAQSAECSEVFSPVGLTSVPSVSVVHGMAG